ncbi:hypothetical protein HHK36_013367 [Tetracentron sinense]|uniref:Protein kinase domain-containing protein n=1 Tax=Tetracentron sinense TaxID=13715 RepID=A0A834ZGY7_TETSI|nr:hypothetical protein HHK36_013367 [Tetracentron sinense]
MVVSNPREIPEYELNPLELQFRKSDESGKNVALNGDLGSYLQKKGRLSPSKALRLALDIARHNFPSCISSGVLHVNFLVFRGMNYLHECKPEPIIHCDLKPKNILLDSGGQLKVSGFGLIKLSKISPDKAKLPQPGSHVDPSSLYVAPEVYKDEIFDRSVDAFSFGLILYEMIEGVPAFHPKAPEDVAKMICLERKRPPFKIKSKSYPPDLKELVEECWDPEPVVRPIFSEIIVRLDKIVANGSKNGWWKDTFKFPWYASLTIYLLKPCVLIVDIEESMSIPRSLV